MGFSYTIILSSSCPSSQKRSHVIKERALMIVVITLSITNVSTSEFEHMKMINLKKARTSEITTTCH